MSLSTARVQFIVPKEATNYVTNPSFEIDTTGYTAFGAGVSVARATTQSRRGIASLEITTASGVVSGVYYAIALTSGTQYSFSADIKDVAGQTFNLFIASATAGTLASTNTTWTGTGYWKRRSVTWTATSSATFYLFVTRSAVASTTAFYTDGWQLETGAVSTYLDGSMFGFVIGVYDYRWNGTKHASTSWRSGQTRSGGTYVNLSTYAKLIAIVGLGLSPVSNVGIPSSQGGSHYQNTVLTERPFSLIVNFNSPSDYAVIQRARTALENCVKSDLTSRPQPILIQYDALDANGLEIAETLFIPCLYETGLGGNTTPANEKAAINFRMFMPLLYQQGETGVTLGYQTSVTGTNYLLTRSSSGVWSTMAGGAPDIVSAIAEGSDGYIYAGGAFVNLGDANGDRVARWNGTAWSGLASGMNQPAYAIAVGPDGKIYFGGGFTNVGDANGDYIVRWTGSAWESLGTGITTGSAVYALAFGPDGSLYVGGNFTVAGGVADTAFIAKWNGTVWSPLATGANGVVRAIAVDSNNNVYIGGDFTNLGGAGGDYISKWNGTAWETLGTGMDNVVYTLAIDNNNSIYAGGTFHTANGLASLHIAGWDSSGRGGLFFGHDLNNDVGGLFFDKRSNLLYATGSFTTAGGVALPDGVAIWNGSAWMPIDVDLPGASTGYGIFVDKNDNVYLNFSATGTATSATVTAPNVGSAITYPVFNFTGPGTLYQIKNYTTGKSIFFNLTLLAGETAVLNLNPIFPFFRSSFRDNIWNTILPGSDTNWFLQPGTNNVSAYMYGGTTAASSITMTWREGYKSIDSAVR